MRFENDKFAKDGDSRENRVVKESKIKWLGIHSHEILRQERVNYIRVTEIELHDHRGFQLHELTEENETIFSTV